MSYNICRYTVLWAFLGILPATPVSAEAILKFTEVWPGGFLGAEATSDWFELTNFGDMPATGIDGNYFFDDASNSPAQSDPLRGIDTINVGESVIFITSWEDDFNAVTEDAIAAFEEMWGPLGDVQVGYVPFGSGFGGSDAAVLFDSNQPDANTIDFIAFDSVGSVASFVSEPDGTWVPRLAQAGVWGAYAGNLPAHDLAPDPPIGSPGVVVPEPGCGSLLAIAGVVVGL
ncbi:MAG: hypothetical protein KDA60_13320, partial [Planctomycetales bacterium]|nr:hypothetical protein [Planctomycetales bacterium]